MATNKIKYFCFGCLSGASLFYLKVDSDFLKKNQIIKNDLELLKKSLDKDESISTSVNKEENVPIEKKEAENNLSTSIKSILFTKYPNDMLIFKFICKTYLPEGILTLLLKAIDFNNKKV